MKKDHYKLWPLTRVETQVTVVNDLSYALHCLKSELEKAEQQLRDDLTRLCAADPGAHKLGLVRHFLINYGMWDQLGGREKLLRDLAQEALSQAGD